MWKGRRPAAGTQAAGGQTVCQKCYQPGHWTYECKNARVYVKRPTRTQQLLNPKVRFPVQKPCALRQRRLS